MTTRKPKESVPPGVCRKRSCGKAAKTTFVDGTELCGGHTAEARDLYARRAQAEDPGIPYVTNGDAVDEELAEFEATLLPVVA